MQPLLNPLQPKSKVLQVCLTTIFQPNLLHRREWLIMALQFQELSPVLFTLMKSTEPFLDEYYMLDLEETIGQVGFVNVCSILTDPRHRTVTATVPYWIEVTKPLKFSRSKHFTKQNLVCLTGLPLKNQVICISVHAANNRLKNGCILTFECLIARSCWSDVSRKHHKIEYKCQWKNSWCMAENSFYQVILNCSSADLGYTWCSKGWNIGLTNTVQWKLTVGISRQNLHNHSVTLD